MTLAAGSRLGPYEILGKIGAGGMGEVYKARDTRLERTVAVKVLPRHLSSSPDVRQRFEREARTISQLSHPHICALHDVGREGDEEYLVMELLEGEPLSERIARGALPLEQTLRYGSQIADALDKAHRQGIVHRDLKPGNVMITKTGVKLLDFGLAKGFAPQGDAGVTASPTQANLTEKGTILGTFQYMAPEQLEGKDADARTDIFALGATLYEMATGRKAFSGSTQASLISSILRDDPPPISQVQPMSPPALDRVIRACLAKDPEDRWQSAGDVGKELRWLSEGSSSVTTSGVVSPGRWRGRRALPWVAAGLLLLLALVLGQELRKARASRPAPVHSFLLPPEKTSFRLTGDDAAPVAVSPGGDRVVFGAGGKLWVQSLRTGVSMALAGTEGARTPFWSPDGRSLGFFAEGKLRRIDATGGPVVTICDAPNSRGGSWLSSGEIVFAPDIRTGIFRVSAAGGGAAQAVTRVDEKIHTTHRWPSSLPDGRHFLYQATSHNNPRSEQAGIYVASLDGGEPRRLVSTYGGAQYASGRLLYCADTSVMAVRYDTKSNTISGEPFRIFDDVHYDTGIWRGNISVSSSGVAAYQKAQAGVGGQLTWLDFSGRVLGKIGEKSEAYSPQISPDGRRAAMVLGDPANDIWIYDLGRGIRTRLTTGALATPAPLWSPDGSEIVYTSQAKPGTFVLSAIPSDGSGKPREIYTSTERIEPSDWSRDGRHVLVTRGSIGASDIWVVPLADPSKTFPLVVSPASLDTSAQFSPDGRWVAYRSNESARSEIFVTPFPAGGARFQISVSGATQPRWSPDGHSIYYVSSDGDLVQASIKTEGSRLDVQEARALFPTNLYFGPRVGLVGYVLRPDGKAFLANSAGDVGASRVELVVNWDAVLPR